MANTSANDAGNNYEKTKDLRNFIIGALLVFIFSLLIALVTIYLNQIVPAPYKLPELNSAGGILQGTLGIAVSLAGAYVAIRIASLGHDLLKKESRRDNFSASNDVINLAIPPILKVAQEYQKLVDIYNLVANEYIDPLIREALEETFGDFLRDFSKRDEARLKFLSDDYQFNFKKVTDYSKLDLSFLKGLQSQLTELRKALEELKTNQFSYYMFRELAKVYESKNICLLEQHKEIIADRGSAQSKRSTFTIANGFNDLIFYLKLFEGAMARKISDPMFSDLYMPFISLVNTTEMTEQDLKELMSDTAELKFYNISPDLMIMSLGLIICYKSTWINARDDDDKELKSKFQHQYFNFGGVILIDLINILSQGYDVYQTILEKKLLSNVELEDLKTKSPFLKILESELKDNNNIWFDSALIGAVTKIREKNYKFKFFMNKIKPEARDL